MSKSKLITVGLAATIAVTTGYLIMQRTPVAAPVEQEAAKSYRQAHKEQLSASSVSKPREILLASQPDLPDLVVSAPRYGRQVK